MKHNPFVLMIATAMGIVALPAAAETLCGGASDPVRVDLTSGTRTPKATETIVYSPFWAKDAGASPTVNVFVDETSDLLVNRATKAGTHTWTPTEPGTYTLKHDTWNGDTLVDTLTATFEVLAKVTVADVTGATYAAYTNDAPATVPFVVSATTPIKVVYTADAGYMFPGGYQTFTTNLTATAKEMTVALTAGQEPVAATTCADCIAFTSANSFTLKTANGQKNWDGTLETSTDKIYWTEWKGALVAAAQAGGAYNLYVRGNAANTTITTSSSKKWVLTGSDIACTGNIETLRGATGDKPSSTTLANKCYQALFYGCTALTAAPALPATELADSCYYNMFYGCTSLTAAPALPATNLLYGCYGGMFKDCTSLTAAPELPATNLAESCYMNMFDGCTALTAAPALPATEMMRQCYYGMFQKCTSLTAAPALPATNMVDSCYLFMFSGCKALTDVPALLATKMAFQCYSCMFMNCTALTDVPALPASELAERCYNCMFMKCTALEVNTNGTGKAWSLPSEAAASAATATDWNYNMFSGTAGDITNTVVTPGVAYYVKSAIKRVTVVVPEIEGATAQLYAFDVNGGWAAVETNAVPSNATVRVVWTAADDKVLTGEDAVNVFRWRATFVADKALQDAPAPTVGDEGDSSVKVRVDTRAKKAYFDVEDILPIWYPEKEEVKVKGEGEQSPETLVKDAVANDTLLWTPTTPDTYDFTYSTKSAQIIYALPVEVTTNGLEVAGTTVKVTDESGNPLVAQTEGEFTGKIIVPSNSTVKATWTATGTGVYFMDGTREQTQSFTADKPVNAVSEAVTKPEEPKEPSVKVGIVGQRYPWDGKLDVQYWAKNTPNKGWRIKVTVTVDGEAKDQEVKALNGKNTMVFDMRKVFGEVTVKNVKVKAELEKEK